MYLDRNLVWCQLSQRPKHLLVIASSVSVLIWFFVGVVQATTPYKGILDDKHLLGCEFDSMMRLKSYFGLKHVFGIITTYEEWRIVWLPDASDVARADTSHKAEKDVANEDIMDTITTASSKEPTETSSIE